MYEAWEKKKDRSFFTFKFGIFEEGESLTFEKGVLKLRTDCGSESRHL